MDDEARLQEVIGRFRQAEEALSELTRQANELQTAASVLKATRGSLENVGHRMAELAETTSSMILQLGSVSSTLADTSKAFQKIEPSKVLSEVERVRAQLEGTRSRLDEVAGELKQRISGYEEGQREREIHLRSFLEASQRRLTKYVVITGMLTALVLGGVAWLLAVGG